MKFALFLRYAKIRGVAPDVTKMTRRSRKIDVFGNNKFENEHILFGLHVGCQYVHTSEKASGS